MTKPPIEWRWVIALAAAVILTASWILYTSARQDAALDDCARTTAGCLR